MRLSLLSIFGKCLAPAVPAGTSRPRHRLRAAIGTLDMIIAGAIMTAGVAAVVVSGGDNDDESKATQFIESYAAFQMAMRADAPNYGTGTQTASVLIDNGMVPGAMQNGTNLRHPWSRAATAVTVTAATSTWTFTTDQTVTKAGCTTILRKLTNSQGVTQVTVGGGAAVTTLPADKTAASTACSGATNAITITSS